MTLSLWRIVVARLIGHRRSVAPLLGAFVLATALLVVLPETAYLSSAAALQTVINSLPTSTSTVQVLANGLGSDQATSEFEQGVRLRAAGAEHGFLHEVSFRIASPYFPLNSHNGQPLPAGDPANVISFATHSDLQLNAELVSGNWSAPAPSGVVSITLSEVAANRFSVKPGDRLCVSNGVEASAICLSVAGIWRPKVPAAAYWTGDDSLPIEAEVSRSDLATLVANSTSGFQATVVLVPNLPLIDRSDPAVVAASLIHLGPALGGNVLYRQVVTGLDAAVAAFNQRSVVGAYALEFISAQLWLIGLYCLAFLIGIRLESDRLTVAVWRTRGWPRRLVATLLSAELLAIAGLALIPGLPAGFGLGWAITRAVYPGVRLATDFSVGAVAPVVGLGLLVMAGLIVGLAVIAARVGVVPARVEASRPKARWWSSPWVAAAAAVVAVPILAEARALGDARVREAGAGLPYDLLLPGVGMALIAFAGISLLPIIARVFARAARGIEARLAAIQLARASGRQQRLSLLLAAAVALALLAAAYSGTASQNATDRAAYAAGADLRVITAGSPPLDFQPVSIAGATAQTDVLRAFARPPGTLASEVEALGVDPYTFGGVGWSRPGLMSPDLGTLMRKLASSERGGTLLPVAANGLSIWVYGNMTGGSLTASFTDANMMPVTADFGGLDFAGWKQLTASFVPVRFKAPLRLRHLTLAPVTNEGTVAFSDLEATTSGGVAQSVYGFDSTDPLSFLGWWQSDGTSGAKLQALQPDDRFLRDGQLTTHIFLSPGWLPVTINPPVIDLTQSRTSIIFAPSPGQRTPAQIFGQIVTLPVPMLVSSGLLSTLQVKVGDMLAVQVGNVPVDGVIVGTFDYFPTLYGDGLVYSLPPLLQVLGYQNDQDPHPTEVWASVPASRAAAVTARLMSNSNVVQVVSRFDLEQQSAADPLGAAGRADFLLGFAAACALAVAAFAIYFAFAAAARTSEYAILQANGLSPGQVRRSLLIEQLLIVAFSSLLGLVVGAVLSIVLLPSLTVSTSLADTIPPTALAINLWLALVGIGIAIVACLMAGRLVALRAHVGNVMPELRSLG